MLRFDFDDFPLKGFAARLVRDITPRGSESARVDEAACRQNPGMTFTGLVAHIFQSPDVRLNSAIGWFCEVVFAACYTLMPLILTGFTDDLLLGGETITYADILKLIALAVFITSVSAVFNFMGVRYADLAGSVVEAQARRQVTWWAMGHSAGWFSVREAGQTAHRIAEIAKQFNMLSGLFAYHVIHALTALVIVTVVMFWIHWLAGLAFLGWAMIFIVMAIQFGLISQKFMMRTVRRRTRAAGLVTDIIINNALVRSFGAQKREDDHVNRAGDSVHHSFMHGASWARLKNYARDTWLVMLFVVMMFVLGHVLIQDEITPGQFIGALGILMIMVAQVRALHHLIRDIMEAIGVIREALLEVGVPHDVTEKPDAKNRTLMASDIALKNVSFTYENSRPVLQDVDLHIEQGQKVGLVGPSGAGKTTLMALIMRFWDIEQGAIEVGGQDIRDLSFETLRANMSLIPQDTTMFHRTLLENIAYGRPDASEDEVIDAAKQAHAHEFISELMDGYHTQVGERGIKLSGGQRQRIAIARAILRDAPILILDEATSALDSESEQLIQESLKDLMKGKTVIAIAHRLSTIARLDRLVVMDQGCVVEDGTHEELLKQDGLYAKLWAMQSGGFLGDE